MTQNAAPQQHKVAVIGGGVAGLTAAWLLQRVAPVELFERNDYVGGHTCTVTIPDGPDAGLPVDVGYIVMNHRNYPLLTRLFRQLGVELGDSDMSFGYHDARSGYAYCGSNLAGLFAQPANLFRADHWRMLRDVTPFNRRARADLLSGALQGVTLGDYLARGRFSRAFADHYLLAMGSAIWSAPAQNLREFPALPFVRFFHNHGLLALQDRPEWKFVRGGSQSYVRAMLKGFHGQVHLRAQIAGVRRTPAGVRVRMRDGADQHFSHVVLAAHADESLALLEDPSPRETALLGAWRYQTNAAVLHTDAAVMPRARRAWASWNFQRVATATATRPVSITYHMNRLQRLDAKRPYFVTLNGDPPVAAEHHVRAFTFTHPMYSFAALASQAPLREQNGVANTFYCGSYLGFGFHEDAVRAATDVATHFGVTL